MSTVTTNRQIDLAALGFPASQRWDGTTGEVSAEVDVSTLRAAVDAAPADPTPQREANDATLRQQAQANLAVLRTSIDTLKTITDKTNANIGPADTKAVAREARRVARQLVALTWLFLGELDSADIGTD